MELTTLIVGIVIRRVRVVVEVAMQACTHAVMVVDMREVVVGWRSQGKLAAQATTAVHHSTS